MYSKIRFEREMREQKQRPNRKKLVLQVRVQFHKTYVSHRPIFINGKFSKRKKKNEESE